MSDDVAEAVVADLKVAGYSHAAVIGHFFDTPRAGSAFKITVPQEGRNQSGSCPIQASEISVWLD